MSDTPAKHTQREYDKAEHQNMPDMTKSMQDLLMMKDTKGKYILTVEAMRQLNREKTGRGKPPHASMGWKEYRERLELENTHRDLMSEWRKRAAQRLEELGGDREEGIKGKKYGLPLDDEKPTLEPRVPPWKRDRKKFNYPDERASLDEQKQSVYNTRPEMGSTNRFGRGW